ncbi:alpha-hydroxy acid oxidase [Aliiglaciecola lipolytica]|uniref:L-lactate dehydrogenase n=1 Tax=Aliiglaciecola lipolytica E3 TaxID=1127673 RepID=K6XZ27_9ALTE|nr:alpha-hydroxy acid oxidase [Aliiglaciecola lipolytica]GAC16896.1 L-lactate dehydrogenase [Aliiglaciecola lipolytica E3]
MNKSFFDPRYPDSNFLRKRASQRMPGFAFDYLEGGCIDEVGLRRNQNAIEQVQLRSELLKVFDKSDLTTELFGHKYDLPFGIAPVGLQGLMWPKAPEILAKAAADLNIPYILSTVSSSSLEKVSEVSEGRAWFQLYNPTVDHIREDLMKRIHAARVPVLVVTVDVPTFGYRIKDIRNGLSMPPKMNLRNIIQMIKRPAWLFATALAGEPQMQTLKPYMPKNMPVDQLAEFMNSTVMGRVDIEGLKPIRDQWQGPLVVKGLVSEADVQLAIELGADAVVLSNHGARQLDAGESPVQTIEQIAAKYGDKIKIFMDSGIRSGSHIACALAKGADFTFLGRSFVYGVGALGEKGGYHTINMLKKQLEQTMNQLRCASVKDLPDYLVR